MHRFTFIGVLALMVAIAAGVLWLGSGHILLFHPQGAISSSETRLIALALELMLLVVVPVFILTFVIAWHYRASNTKARYLPDWEHNAFEEAIWWFVPIMIIATLAVITWKSTHALDPYKTLASDEAQAPLTIDVVSLNWKWLFIYPEQGIATVNYLAIPAGMPVTFKLTSDAPMNAFWIPQLGGQMMTMPGMITQLNLKADHEGTYLGMSSNFSGDGFAGMQFPVHAMSENEFEAWVAPIAHASSTLTWPSYQSLAKPSENDPAAFYALGDQNLYTEIVMQYMASTSPSMMATSSMQDMPGMNMDMRQMQPMIPAAPEASSSDDMGDMQM